MLNESLLAAFGACGFGLLFGMKRTRLWIVFLASSVAWYGYLLLCQWFGNEIPAMFLTTVFVVVFAKIITLFVESPVILFSTPILIPFIPGAALYSVMYDVVSKSDRITKDMWLLACQVGAMVLGILVAEMIVIVARKVREEIL